MRCLVYMSLVLLSACATVDSAQPHTSPQAQCGQPDNPDTAVRLDVAEKLMTEGRLYAALAHLDDLQQASLRSTYLRAEILRQSRRAEEAKPLYQQLLTTCMQGEGYHGLGLIAGREGQLDSAIEALSQSAKLLPLNPRVRNDYGYALLLDGHYELAQREFLTAVELDEESRLARTNLVLLLYLQGDRQKAQAYAQSVNMDKKTQAELQQQAASLAGSSP